MLACATFAQLTSAWLLLAAILWYTSTAETRQCKHSFHYRDHSEVSLSSPCLCADAFVFCSFNAASKFEPDTYRVRLNGHALPVPPAQRESSARSGPARNLYSCFTQAEAPDRRFG